MKCLVTGCAGFIGSNLVDRLLSMDNEVVGLDNLSTGKMEFIENAVGNEKFNFFECDLYCDDITKYFHGIDVVFHLAANADVRFGTNHPRKDLEQNTIVTYNVLESMRANNVQKIVFSSTGSVYGESKVIPTPENGPFPIQTSLYGASKAACEGLISSYCEGFGFQSWIYRFVSILGERYTHGHLFDFYKKLSIDMSNLDVLGDGKQKKSYLYIQDCIDGILIGLRNAKDKVNIMNLGTDEFCEVNDSIKILCKYLNVDPKLHYSGGNKGWIGDNPFIYLDIKKMRSLGWQPKYTIAEGIIKTIDYLDNNKWVFKDKNNL